jgi:AcrR family transcriptional regulator
MASKQPRVGEQRPGGRAARIRACILEATFELLADVGYERLIIEEVAARAGVHKTTVYRRWPTKAELVLDATRVFSERDIPIPDTGSLSGDLQALARDVAANIGAETGARRTRSIVAAAASSSDLAASMHTFWAERLALTVPIIDRAIEREEIPASSDANLIIETLIGPMWVRLLLTGEIIDNDFADRVAELVATACSP